MKTTRILLLGSLSVFIALGQERPKPTTKEAKAPEMTEALKAKYWKARARQLAAQKESGDADTAMQAIVTELQTFCGPTSVLSGDRNGDASCQLKEPPKDAEKPSTK